MTTAVVPGSFDPVTFGHLDVIARTTKVFDLVRVVVVHNPAKRTRFTAAERMALIRTVVADAGVERVEVDEWSAGLLVDYCRQVGADAIVKGVRSAVDVGYETPMAMVNRDLAGIETVLLIGDPALGHISSSLVKQVADLGGDVAKYVPAPVVEALGGRS